MMENQYNFTELKQRLYLAKNYRPSEPDADKIKLYRLCSMPLREFFRGRNDRFLIFYELTDKRFEVSRRYADVCKSLSEDFFNGYYKFFLRDNDKSFEECDYLTKPLRAMEILADTMIGSAKNIDCAQLPSDSLFYALRMTFGNYVDCINSFLDDENNHLYTQDYLDIADVDYTLIRALRNIRSCCDDEYFLIKECSAALESKDRERLINIAEKMKEHGDILEETDSNCSYVLSFSAAEPQVALKALQKRYFGLVFRLYRLIIQPFGYEHGLNFSQLITDDLKLSRFRFSDIYD